jgi:hypothetical protein
MAKFLVWISELDFDLFGIIIYLINILIWNSYLYKWISFNFLIYIYCNLLLFIAILLIYEWFNINNGFHYNLSYILGYVISFFFAEEHSSYLIAFKYSNLFLERVFFSIIILLTIIMLSSNTWLLIFLLYNVCIVLYWLCIIITIIF